MMMNGLSPGIFGSQNYLPLCTVPAISCMDGHKRDQVKENFENKNLLRGHVGEFENFCWQILPLK